MKIVENTRLSDRTKWIEATTTPGIPALVFVFEVEAKPLGFLLAENDEQRRRLLLSLGSDWIEMLAAALGIDLDELLDE